MPSMELGRFGLSGNVGSAHRSTSHRPQVIAAVENTGARRQRADMLIVSQVHPGRCRSAGRA